MSTHENLYIISNLGREALDLAKISWTIKKLIIGAQSEIKQRNYIKNTIRVMSVLFKIVCPDCLILNFHPRLGIIRNNYWHACVQVYQKHIKLIFWIYLSGWYAIILPRCFSAFFVSADYCQQTTMLSYLWIWFLHITWVE